MSAGTLIDIDHLRSWTGREEAATDVVSVDLVRKFNATLNITAELPQAGDPAPLMVHYCLAPTAALTDTLADDGHAPKGEFLPPVPLPRRMWAGSSLRFEGCLRIGDEVRRVSRIADVVVKVGRSGPLCFVTVEHTFEAAGVRVIEERQDIIYRAAASPTEAKAPATEAPPGTAATPMTVSAPLLFRYSAITFNGHRIHYDRPFATEVEHYAGLVVHGPLQATWLIHYASALQGRAPSRFSFRGLAPVFDEDRIWLHATEEEGRLRLWTARENGPVAMSAEAWWS